MRLYAHGVQDNNRKALFAGRPGSAAAAQRLAGDNRRIAGLPARWERAARWERRAGRAPLPSLFFAVNGGLGIVVAPVEPVVFEHGNRLQAQALRLARSGATLEVPLASGGGVHQQSGRRNG